MARSGNGNRACPLALLLALPLAALPGSAGAQTAAPANAARPAAPDYLHRAERGDTLIGIGQRLLERPGDWPTLQKLNAIANPRRIPTGTIIRIPVRLLRGEPVPGRIEQAVGSASVVGLSGTKAASLGAALAEGERIETGADGYVTVRLVDGSALRVQAASLAVLEQSRRYPQVGFFAAAWRLVSGRVEAVVNELTGGEPRYEVRTPQSVLGVRGTEFRVAADATRAETRGEVLTGIVDVGGAGGASTRVPAGFATVVDAQGVAAPPVALLPAPDLGGQPVLYERLVVRFEVPAVAGAARYRAQVASDREFRAVAAEAIADDGRLRFAGLADQDWFLRVRAIDARGLEGRDAVLAFRVKARPEPPVVNTPQPHSKQRAESVEFAWTTNPDAATYDFQVGADATFAAPLQERRALAAPRLDLALAPGTYHWRVASVRADGDRGPWGDPVSFVLGGLPTTPAAAVEEGSVRFGWTGEPGQTFEFEMARERAFADVIVARTLAEPQLALPRPGPGTYYIRYRARDADGFVGPFTSPQSFEVPLCVLDGSGNCIRASTGTLAPQQ